MSDAAASTVTHHVQRHLERSQLEGRAAFVRRLVVLRGSCRSGSGQIRTGLAARQEHPRLAAKVHRRQPPLQLLNKRHLAQYTIVFKFQIVAGCFM